LFQGAGRYRAKGFKAQADIASKSRRESALQISWAMPADCLTGWKRRFQKFDARSQKEHAGTVLEKGVREDAPEDVAANENLTFR